MEETKICVRCGVRKPLTSEFFPVRSRDKSGLAGTCKTCRYWQNKAIRDRKRVQKHIEEPIVFDNPFSNPSDNPFIDEPRNPFEKLPWED